MVLVYNETVEQLNHMAQTLVDAWNAHDVEGIVDFYAADYEGIDVAEALPQRGQEGMREAALRYLAAFPDLRLTDIVTVAQGDQVALSWTAQATHRGPVLNIPPTNRRIRVRGMSLFTVQDGKIWSSTQLWDVAGLLRSIGLLPEL